MGLNHSNSSHLEQLALKGLISRTPSNFLMKLDSYAQLRELICVWKLHFNHLYSAYIKSVARHNTNDERLINQYKHHPRMRLGNTFGHVCLSVSLEL